MRIFDDCKTAGKLAYNALIPAIKNMFIEGCVVPRRHNYILHDKAALSDTLLIMPAWQEGKYLGVKHVTVFPENSAKGIAGLYSTYTLFDLNNGKPLAFIDGDQITKRRTAAASALAASYLARKDAAHLLIVGAGNVASELAYAYAAVRPIKKVSVWNITAKNAQRLVAKLRQDGFDAQYEPDLSTAVKNADIVSCATLSRAPLILRQWLQPGTHLDLIGSFQPSMRETDDATFMDTAVFVDTTEALEKAGDLLSPIKNKVFEPDRVISTLTDLCKQKHAGRLDDSEITVYKAVGSASEDLAAAILVYESCNGE